MKKDAVTASASNILQSLIVMCLPRHFTTWSYCRRSFKNFYCLCTSRLCSSNAPMFMNTNFQKSQTAAVVGNFVCLNGARGVQSYNYELNISNITMNHRFVICHYVKVEFPVIIFSAYLYILSITIDE